MTTFTPATAVNVRMPIDGALSVPLLLDSPHSGDTYPDDFVSLLPMIRLRRAEDAFVNQLFGEAPTRGVALVEALFPRSYMDTNRSKLDFSPEDLSDDWPGELHPSDKGDKGTGLVWVRMHGLEEVYAKKLSSAELKNRIDTCWAPYHSAVEDLYQKLHTKFGCVYHLNCHSTRAVGNQKDVGGVVDRPDFILSDRDGTSCEPEFVKVSQSYLEGLGYSVSINFPFKGAELIERYSDPSTGRHSMQIEINRRFYMDEEKISKLPEFEDFKIHISGLTSVLAEYAKSKI